MEHLIFTVNDWTCGVPLRHVAEVSRPLPIHPIPDAPPFLLGVSRLRGSMVPVVDAGILLERRDGPAGRFLRLETEGLQLALAVGSVEGIAVLAAETREAIPPLLGPELEWAEALGSRDGRLLLVLRTLALVRRHGQESRS